MAFVNKHALAIVLIAGISQAVAVSQSALPPAQSSRSRTPALLEDWANRLQANDPKVRATAAAALVQGAGGSLPLLKRLLNPAQASSCTPQ